MKFEYEDYLQAGGSPFMERPRNPDPFHEDNQTKDPSNYYIPVPERDRVKLSGAVVEGYIERDLREFLERYGEKWRTMSDIARSGYYLFHSLVVATGSTWDALNRAKAAARIRRLKLEIEYEEKDKQVAKDAIAIWKKIKPHRFDLRNQVIADVRMYWRGIDPQDEGRIEAFLAEIRKVEGLAVAAESPKMAEDEPLVLETPLEADPALETVGGNDGE